MQGMPMQQSVGPPASPAPDPPPTPTWQPTNTDKHKPPPTLQLVTSSLANGDFTGASRLIASVFIQGERWTAQSAHDSSA